MRSNQYSYPAHVVVEKVIHLWRHPWDNVVARFHHVRRHLPAPLLSNLASYCRVMDGFAWRPTHKDAKRKNTTATTGAGPVWCQSELDRYLQWHVNAMEMEQANENTMIVLHVKYEDYQHDVDATLKRILKVLHLDQVRNDLTVPFEPNNTYANLLSLEQMHAIAVYVKERASPRVWEKIAAYFEEWF
jgi:Sulfotransferase domain